MPKDLKVTESPIPGLLVVELPVHGDARGWFKENWQNEKLTQLGFPSFKPVQNNISFNDSVGTTRGIHAEPWDKYVSVANGKVFGAWVDLRDGDSFGKTFSIEIDPSIAVFVPRGVGNAYQTLEPNTSYAYLVNDHWSPTAKYTFLNLADESANIQWPIPLSEVEISDKDKLHPRLKDVTPFKAKKTMILGANGQLGKALQLEFPEAIALTRSEFDLADTTTWDSLNWHDVDVIINSAAYTKVDEAETPEGRKLAWAINATGVGHLAKKCQDNDITLVHISSDYVFDGTKETPYTEVDPLSPLGVYGQTKAAGDLLVSQIEKHYIIRTSWVIGESRNFVNTMMDLFEKGQSPHVVSDQFGRITFTSTISSAIKLFLRNRADFGTYNVSNSGIPTSWFEISKTIYQIGNYDSGAPEPIDTTTYLEQNRLKGKLIAPRPKYSILDLTKLENLGFQNLEHELHLTQYLYNGL